MDAGQRSFDAYFLTQSATTPTLSNPVHPKVASAGTHVKETGSFEEERETRVYRACDRCRRLRQKCDNARPCRACVQRGCAGACVEWDRSRALIRKLGSQESSIAGANLVHRPIAWNQAAVHVHKGDQGTEAGVLANGQSSNRAFLSIALRNLGLNRQTVEDILQAIPLELSDVLMELMRSVSQRTPFARSLLAGGHRRLRQHGRSHLNKFPQLGYIKCTFGPAAAGMTYDFEVNDGFCRMLCLHPEEVLARTQRDELELPMTRFDMLCNLADSLNESYHLYESGPVIKRTRFYVMLRHGRGAMVPVFCRSDCLLTVDGTGNLLSSETFFRPISAEEYNLHRRISPALCRPFSSAKSDASSGAQLLSCYQRDGGMSLLAWSKTADGERAFRDLTAQIRGCCVRRMEVAWPATDDSRQHLPSRLAEGQAETSGDSDPVDDETIRGVRSEGDAGRQGVTEGAAGVTGGDPEDGAHAWSLQPPDLPADTVHLQVEAALAHAASAASCTALEEDADVFVDGDTGPDTLSGGGEIWADVWNAANAGFFDFRLDSVPASLALDGYEAQYSAGEGNSEYLDGGAADAGSGQDVHHWLEELESVDPGS